MASVWVAAPARKHAAGLRFAFFQVYRAIGHVKTETCLQSTERNCNYFSGRAVITFGLMDMKEYWEIIAKNLSKAGWAWGFVRAINSDGQTIFVANAHRRDGKRFIVRAHKLLTAFVELESAIRVGIPEKNIASGERLQIFA